MRTTGTTQTLGVECDFSVAEISKFQNKVHTTGASLISEEKRCRKVDFNEVVIVRQIDLAASEYSRHEMEECWFTRIEYQKMRREMSQTVKMIERGDFYGANTKTHCARGLEFRSPIKAKEKRRAKDIIVLSVLIEQAEQEENNVYNPKALAMVSTRCSSVGRSQAEMRGKMDAIEARELMAVDHSHKNKGGTKMQD